MRRADSLIPIKRKAASYGGNCVVAIGWDQCRDGYMAIRQHGQQLLIEPVTKSLPDMSATGGTVLRWHLIR